MYLIGQIGGTRPIAATVRILPYHTFEFGSIFLLQVDTLKVPEEGKTGGLGEGRCQQTFTYLLLRHYT